MPGRGVAQEKVDENQERLRKNRIWIRTRWEGKKQLCAVLRVRRRCGFLCCEGRGGAKRLLEHHRGWGQWVGQSLAEETGLRPHQA